MSAYLASLESSLRYVKGENQKKTIRIIELEEELKKEKQNYQILSEEFKELNWRMETLEK